MSTRRVKFHQGRSNAEELEKAKRFAPVLEYLATVWDVNISVDAPDGKPVPPVDGSQDEVCVHIYSFAGTPGERMESNLVPALFGWDLPKPPGSADGGGAYKITGRGVGAGFKWTSARQVEGIEVVRSSEMANSVAVAEVVSSNIYILFDVAYAEWEGDALVLWHVLSAALTKLRGHAALEETWAREIILRNTLHDNAVEVLTAEEQERFIQACRAGIGSRFEGSQKERDEKRKAAANALEAIHKLGVERLVVEAYLRHGQQLSVVPYDAGEQFDTLLSWDAVKGVRIEDRDAAKNKTEAAKTMEDRRIVVYTNPLTMELSDDRRFLIGEYQIVIEPVIPKSESAYFLSDLKNWMLAAEYGWRGPYQHGTVTTSVSTHCWGDGAISPAVADALMESNFVFAIQDILAFLTAESAGGKGDPSAEDLLREPPPPESLYQDAADQEKERKRFINFAASLRAKSTKEAREKRKRELVKEQGTKMEELIQTRVSLMDLEHRVAFLGSCMDNVPFEQEYISLLAEPGLVALHASDKAIWAVFGPMMGGTNPAQIQGGIGVRVTKAGEITAYGMTDLKPMSETLEVDYPLLHELIELGMLGSAMRLLRELVMGMHGLHNKMRTEVTAILANSGMAAAEEVAPETGPN